MLEGIIFWTGFHILLVLMLYLDLKVQGKKHREISSKEAFFRTCGWIGLSLLFNLFVYISYDNDPVAALQFFTGYVIEMSLSIDNIFIFILLFSSFKVPTKFQHKVLAWGIIITLVLRLCLIIIGVDLVERFHWITYVLGAFLCYTGLKLAFDQEKKVNFKQHIIVKWVRKHFPITDEFVDGHFFVKKEKRLFGTPLFLVMLLVGVFDFMFALDSIPAIFAITNDAFIIYTSNVFALLGLRSLYFALSGAIDKFHYLNEGIATILVFIGLKMVIAPFYVIPVVTSLLVIATILTVAISFSILKLKKR